MIFSCTGTPGSYEASYIERRRGSHARPLTSAGSAGLAPLSAPVEDAQASDEEDIGGIVDIDETGGDKE